MKVLIIGGMHGNEPLGIDLVRLFQAQPVRGVDVVLANEQAIRKVSRYTAQDLNRSFPGNLQSSEYEQKRAAELLLLSKNYDFVIDFHNTHCPDNDCSFIGEDADEQLLAASSWLGLTRVIVADYECINKYARNCISVEISLSSKRMSTQTWYDRIVALTKLTSLPATQAVETYRFAYRMMLADKDRLELAQKNLKAFQAIDTNLARAMGVASPAYPIFIDDSYTPYNYGGLLNKL